MITDPNTFAIDVDLSRTMPSMLSIDPFKTRPRILVVDDDPFNFDLLEDIFESEYDVVSARNGKAALEIAAGEMPDLILLDVMMPGMNGYEVCRRLKAQHRTTDIPVIFITALGDLTAEMRGLELGAADYVTKPVNPPSVRARVHHQIKLKSALQKLTQLAATDALTGLANRGKFDEMLAYEYARHARSGREFSLILLDIDHFKKFNDNFGHACGDDCLRQVAGAITEPVGRSTDLAARFGGEEFAILLPETPLKGAMVTAEKVRQRMGSLVLCQGAATPVTASFGVVSTRHLPGGSAAGLLAQVDQQLYAAKAGGRDRVCAGYVDWGSLSN
jgi:diguanylate cyclase (GGDEF)-like protein